MTTGPQTDSEGSLHVHKKGSSKLHGQCVLTSSSEQMVCHQCSVFLSGTSGYACGQQVTPSRNGMFLPSLRWAEADQSCRRPRRCTQSGFWLVADSQEVCIGVPSRAYAMVSPMEALRLV